MNSFTNDVNEYEEEALRTAKDLGSVKMNLIHAAMGLSSDAGEFVDCIKKHTIYGKELDIENAIEELGDVLWFVVLACNTLDINLSDVMRANIAKLAKRYPNKYTDEAAIARADKKEEVNIQEAINELVDIKPVKTLAGIKRDAAPNTPNKLYNMIANKTQEMKTVWLVSRNHTDFINSVYHAGPFDTVEEAYSYVESGFFMATCEVPA